MITDVDRTRTSIFPLQQAIPIRIKIFIGRCQTCHHGHDDDDDVQHQLALTTDQEPCLVDDELGLFIGGFSASNRAKLVQLGISRVVNCCPRQRTSTEAVDARALDSAADIVRLELDIVDSNDQVCSRLLAFIRLLCFS